METFLAPADNAEVLSVASILNRASIPESPRLVVDGQAIELSQELASVLKYVANQLSTGNSVSIMAHEAKLTTQDAAEFIGVSRPTLIKLIEDHKVPIELIGRHRRIAFGDLLIMQDSMRAQQREALARMREASLKAGEYDADIENPLIR
jgi:excisionase family DNA binding protein